MSDLSEAMRDPDYQDPSDPLPCEAEHGVWYDGQGQAICGSPTLHAHTFYVTFGQQYPRVPHPTFTKAHRDGWVEIEAEDEMAARKVAAGWFGSAWSFIYAEDDEWRPTTDMYPLGCIHKIGLHEEGEA